VKVNNIVDARTLFILRDLARRRVACRFLVLFLALFFAAALLDEEPEDLASEICSRE
jgi:Flp pilus assembly protein protease CpaA